METASESVAMMMAAEEEGGNYGVEIFFGNFLGEFGGISGNFWDFFFREFWTKVNRIYVSKVVMINFLHRRHDPH